MKISDRDKKIILILVLACIVALPIVFVIKPCKEKTDAINGEIVSLTERFNYLLGLKEQQPFFESEIVRLNNEKASLISSYDCGLAQEDLIMFLRNLELDLPLKMVAEGYTEYVETPITNAEVAEDGSIIPAMNAVSTKTLVTFKGEYEPMKGLISSIFTNKEKMNLSLIQFKYDAKTGLLEGNIMLDQYAIVDGVKEMQMIPIPAREHGNESIVDYKIPEILEEDIEGALAGDEEEEEEE